MFMTRQQKQLCQFVESLRQEARHFQIQYARGESNWTGSRNAEGCLKLGRGEPVGVYVAWEDIDGGLNFGWSFRHPTRETKPFDRVEGVLRAISVSKWPLEVAKQRIPQSRLGEFYDFIEEAERHHLKKLQETIAS